MSDPLCERRFKRIVGGETADIIARVWEPKHSSWSGDNGEYDCHVEIEGLPEPIAADVHGVDKMQSLWLGLRAVYHYLRPFQAELTWLGDEPDGKIGAPIVFNPLDLEMQRYFEELLEREFTAYVARVVGRLARPDPSSTSG